MSTRSSARNLFPPLDNFELTIRRRSRVDLTLLNNFEMAAEGPGDLPVPDLRTMNISSSSDTGGLATVISKLDNLGHDMKKLKQNVHAIQVGCQICEGPYLDKECPLNEEVKLVEEVKYGASVNVIPRNIFKYLRRANLRNANMLVQMTDMTKKAPLGNDRTIFDMEKKDHNFMIPAAKILLINNNEPSCPPGTPLLKSLKTYNSHDMQEQQVKKNLRLNENILVKHFCKPIVQTYNGNVRMCPTSDLDKSICDRGVKIYRRSRVGNLRIWYYNHDSERKNMKSVGLSFPNFLLVFDMEIEQLADEYELGIEKRGHILEMIWENCKKIQ
nr:hypothetical protein [Tanacetum cinerariifolium]